MTKSLQLLWSLAIVLLMTSLTSNVYAADINTPPGKLVSVSGKQLHINCIGTGSPVVVLESGLGGNSLDWSRVQPLLGEYTRVCSYDRAGYGWSEHDALPRTSLRIAKELHQLLSEADEGGPYLLVGHSFGGFVVRLFASLYPDETEALVLLDASHEDQFQALKNSDLRKVSRSKNSYKPQKPVIPETMPAALKGLARELAEKPEATAALMSEMRYFQRSANQLRFISQEPVVPVKVITRGKRVWPDNEAGNQLEATWQALQEDLYNRLSPSTVRLSHQFANHSGHYIHLEEPRLVAGAIRKLVMNQRRIALLDKSIK